MGDDARSAICAFLKKNHVLTLSTALNNESWCASCFYSFDDEEMTFFLMTELNTRHGKMMMENPKVSGTIAGQPKVVGKIQGLQFSGTARMMEGDLAGSARKIYLRRFPVAIISKAPLWAIEIDIAKFTDNRLGFGTKLHWSRKENE